jgi:ankyrin repeat protein
MSSFSKKENMIDAVIANDTAQVLALLQEGIHPDFRHNGMTPLAEAIKNNNADLVKALVAAGADVNRPSREDMAKFPLDIADALDTTEIILFLEEHGAPSQNPDRISSAKRALFNAVVEADATKVGRLLAQGVEPDFFVEGETSPLAEAIERGCLEIVDVLIAHGCDVNWRNSRRIAPLDIALKGGDDAIIKKLQDRGAISGQSTPPAPPSIGAQTGKPVFREDTLQDIFAADKWVGSLNEMADLWQDVPKRLKTQFNFSSAYAEAQRKTIKQKAGKFILPRRKP